MEQVNVKLTPSNSSNPTITRTTSNPQLVLPDVAHDTYTLSITSDVYKPYSTSVVLNGEAELNIHLEALVTQSVEWLPRSKVTTIPITTNYTDDPTLNVGIEVVDSEGVMGKITETWEEEYIDGIATGRKRNENTTTVEMEQRQVRRGTKVPDVQLVNILTDDNVSATYSTNIYVDGARTEGDAVPIGGAFELRQWDNPSGALTVSDGDLGPTALYTLAMEMENIGPAVETAKFVIGMSFFGGKHFFNGTEVSIPPSAGEYDFKAHFPNSGKVRYVFQFTTEPGTPMGDYFQVHFDNTANNTTVKLSNLGLYEGHVDPFE